MGSYVAFQKTIEKRIEKVGEANLRQVLKRLPVQNGSRSETSKSDSKDYSPSRPTPSGNR